ncbi:hypothetical protein [Noviherbaspirillum sp. ST9]|uniref:hypothetical protein n=1 Tax=Noviherbaspirillum sp. ST9 TaxID=3401606 RepID=UPI003B589070
MRPRIVPALSLMLTGCVAMTTSGTREAVFFTDDEEATANNAQAVLKPYNDLPVSIEFKCPSRIATLSPSYVVPLPPVFPAGFAHRKVSYLRVRMPEGMDNALAQSRVITRQGTAMPLADARQSRRTVGDEGTVESTFTLDKECEALNGGTLEVAGFSYNNKAYPPSQARLQFDSEVTAGIGWWPPALFNGGHAISGAPEAE